MPSLLPNRKPVHSERYQDVGLPHPLPPLPVTPASPFPALRCSRPQATMGCGGSKPAPKKDYGTTTSAASHKASRTRASDQRSEFDIGPGYTAVKHLGECRGCTGRGRGSRSRQQRAAGRQVLRSGGGGSALPSRTGAPAPAPLQARAALVTPGTSRTSNTGATWQ